MILLLSFLEPEDTLQELTEILQEISKNTNTYC